MDRDSAANFKFNTESEFIPILGLVSSQLSATKAEEKSPEQKEENHDATNIQKHHHSSLLSVLAEELSIQPEEIHDFELYVYSHIVSFGFMLMWGLVGNYMTPNPRSSEA